MGIARIILGFTAFSMVGCCATLYLTKKAIQYHFRYHFQPQIACACDSCVKVSVLGIGACLWQCCAARHCSLYVLVCEHDVHDENKWPVLG